MFTVTSTKVYFDSAPVRDPATGLVVSDTTSPTAALLVAGTDYTVVDTTPGLETITLTPTFVVAPNTALYVLQAVKVPTGTPGNKLYTTSYIWDSVGTGPTAKVYQATNAEPTTVLP